MSQIVREIFYNLKYLTWLNYILFQINALIGKVSYPAYILNATFVDEYYKKVSIICIIFVKSVSYS